MNRLKKLPLPDALGDPIYDRILRMPHLRRYSKDAPWRQRYCYEWTKLALPIARHAFRGTGIDVTKVIVHSPEYHRYIRINDIHEDPIIADGTWLQFSDTGADLPVHRLLFNRRSELPPLLETAGVPQWRWPIWQIMT